MSPGHPVLMLLDPPLRWRGVSASEGFQRMATEGGCVWAGRKLYAPKPQWQKLGSPVRSHEMSSPQPTAVCSLRKREPLEISRNLCWLQSSSECP